MKTISMIALASVAFVFASCQQKQPDPVVDQGNQVITKGCKK
ncbi:hypothetical protein [Akkermansia glycaniphila]|uniref:Lipoprotein n=1 Tax=Akkermansia glycaniphila TaxID=1679444 RepID=A0A1H6L2U3_9BACT|nr:hypothetical protein [Akkermansia glycaniphila]SEH82475.1 Hypothetical protein PYTT_1021 [Akkermansia glycaniphila]